MTMTETSGSPTLEFKPVDLKAHLEVCRLFRIDTHGCHSGSAEHLDQSNGEWSEGYAAWLRQRATNLPGCLVHLWAEDQIIGQIEMGRLASDHSIGYVNLFYLIPERRGQGLGRLLEAYAWTFLSGLGCQALRLSASPTHLPAWYFYQRGGWIDLGRREGHPDVHLLHKEGSDDSAGAPGVINPDDYLETEFGREFTPERNRQAWELAYARLNEELAEGKKGALLYVVMGVQGAGKSRWVSENPGRLGPQAVVFDAALPARRHRLRVLSIAREHGVPVIGIFVQASLELALARNARRSLDKQVPQAALESVFSLLEAPVRDEGFIWTQVIKQASLPAALQTARLRLVTPDPDLAAQLASALNASYELHRDFLLWAKPHWTLLDTQATLQRGRDDFADATAEKKYFLLDRGEAPAVVGCVGLRPMAGGAAGYEIGYWVSQVHANQGLMKEALSALVSKLSEHTLRLTTSSANLASQRLAEAVGFELIQTIPDARTSGRYGVCDTLVYLRGAT